MNPDELVAPVLGLSQRLVPASFKGPPAADRAASPYCTYLYNTTTQVSGGSNAEDRDSRIAFAVRYVKE